MEQSAKADTDVRRAMQVESLKYDLSKARSLREIVLGEIKNGVRPEWIAVKYGLEALKKFGCLRLGARIWELRQEGRQIMKYTARVGRGEETKRIACYYELRGRAA